MWSGNVGVDNKPHLGNRVNTSGKLICRSQGHRTTRHASCGVDYDKLLIYVAYTMYRMGEIAVVK